LIYKRRLEFCLVIKEEERIDIDDRYTLKPMFYVVLFEMVNWAILGSLVRSKVSSVSGVNSMVVGFLVI
jgi:hypothetical protein